VTTGPRQDLEDVNAALGAGWLISERDVRAGSLSTSLMMAWVSASLALERNPLYPHVEERRSGRSS
jgi:hypothetical protein